MKNRLILRMVVLGMGCLFAGARVSAEGSRELTANGGSRAYLYSSSAASASFPYPTMGTVKVYAKVGESINVGSSAQGFGSGTINFRAPNGSTYTSGNAAAAGLISNRTQEMAGPLPNAGGFTPFIRTVLAGEEGVWEIDFVSPSGGTGSPANPAPVAAAANWTQPGGQYVTAFDVSVRNTANTAFLSGRVYTNIFVGILGDFSVGFNGIFKILTKDGYQYTLDNNGQAGNGFSFFVNNKGFRNAGGAPSYKSIDDITSPNVQDPRSADTPSDVTHKIFFNTPAADLPASANTPGGGTTWLMSAPVSATLGNVTFTGIEGTVGKAGTNPLGGYIGFTANKNGNYTIAIDINKNGVFTDAVDRILTGITNAGANQVYWDGLDGENKKVAAGGATTYTINVTTALNGGEVHFPFFDVERNVNGILLTRANGDNSPDYTVYWDDSPITIFSSGTPPVPIVNTSGANSLVNGHKWGTAGAGATEFGNEVGLDTWAYIISSPLIASVTFQLQEADLEVQRFTASAGCIGQPVSYTMAVKNNGPSDVTGSHFGFSFPATLSGVTVSSVATSGTSTMTTGTITGNRYDATLDMANGATRTITVTGTVSINSSGGTLTTSASLLRPADVTDPDATNPDAATPTDALLECNALPSGAGCNNVKSNTITFGPAPNAGADLIIKQYAIPTVTANTAGVWSQIGTTPTVANITNPNNLSTTISGLSSLGTYKFAYTNTAGCADTLSIDVNQSGLPETNLPNIFTPNGDGKNDVFEIKGLGNFPGSQVIIFNRWGNEVYRSDNYLNNWNGSGLAEGTYFYLLNRKESNGSITPMKGWLYLKR